VLEALLGLVPSIINIIGRAVPDANKRMEIQQEITKLLIESQGQLTNAMKDVMVADAASEGWMTRNARPMTVYWCLAMMTWVVIAPIFGLQDATIKAVTAIPEQLWSLSAYGIGAYILGKSGVDIAKAVAGKK
jgi:hypothetical protein